MNAQQPLSPTRSGPVAAIFCGLVLALALSACCGAGRYTPKQGETVAQDIEFIDSRTFDTQVQRAMGVQHPRITVTFPAAITLNSIPERLDKWLYAVQDSGGAVEVAPEPDGPVERGLLEEIFTFFISAFAHLGDACTYSAAREYDALLLYRPETGIVTRVLFLKRPEPRS
ncbi:MAG: hypothetical protein V3573_11945 [Desulfovibrionaceae bacterium]